ncbi:unnamed protein product [Pylaiella littoralis]
MLCDAACLLTPPFSEGNYLSAMKLGAEEDEYLAAGSTVVAPTSDEEVQEKLDGVWAEIKKRAITAVKTAQSWAAGEVGSHGTNLFKRARTGGAGSSRRKNNEDDFSMFGRNEVAPSQNEGDVDLVEEEVSSETMRYKGVFMKSTDLPPTEVLNYWSKRDTNKCFPRSSMWRSKHSAFNLLPLRSRETSATAVFSAQGPVVV